MMKYRMLIMDIDDTLVCNSAPVSEINHAAINRAREAGVYVTLATGRGYYGSSHVWKQLGFSTYIINYGGAVITDSATDEQLFAAELDGEYVREILNMAHDMGLHAHIYRYDHVLYEKRNAYVEKYINALSLPNRMEPELRTRLWTDITKVLIITEPERVDGLLPIFEKHFEGRVHVSASSPGFIEFNKLGANKGAAAAMLAERLGISREETAAIGDNTLDLEMIRWAGLGAAVANANERVKAVADVITPSCAENGVAWLIDNYILNQ